MSVQATEAASTTGVDPAAIPPPRRHRTIGGIELVGPSIRDPRLQVASVLLSVQVLGQVALGFRLSVAQILVSFGTCALIEVVVQFRQRHQIVWPASGLLTANGVALILRVPGTAHGDWWSLRGAWVFAGAGALSLAVKYLVRVEGRHLFNPSNAGLVLVFVVLGDTLAEPLDFWWGPPSWALTAVYLLVGLGGLRLARRMHLLGVVVAFATVFAASLGVLAATGHQMTARWHLGPIEGRAFWSSLVLSPEVWIFALFMITDPRTVPVGRLPQRAYGATVGLLAVVLIAPQRTEFATKVVLLGALLVACALRPAFERLVPRNDPVPRGAGVAVRAACCGVLVFGFLLTSTPAGIDPGSGTVSLDEREIGSASALEGVRLVVAPSFTAAVAADDRALALMLGDVRAGLAAQSEALRTGSLALARGSAADAWLEHLREEIDAGRRGAPVTVRTWDLDAVTLSAAPRLGQSYPAILVTLSGTLLEETIRGGTVVDTEQGPAIETYEISLRSDRYVFVTDDLPAGWTEPTP